LGPQANLKQEYIESLVKVLDGLGDKQHNFLAYADYLVALEEVLSQTKVGDIYSLMAIFLGY
jgi:dTDP-D-glucose 4,6-dehydratase